MQENEFHKDVWRLIGMIAVLGVLVFVFVIRPTLPVLPPLPIRGQSAQEVARATKDQTRADVDAITTSNPLPPEDDPLAAQKIAQRWKSLKSQDNSPGRSAAIERARQKFPAHTWPLLVRRAYVKDKECWSVVGWHLVWIHYCPVGAPKEALAAIGDDQVKVSVEVVVVEASAPHKILAYSPGEHLDGL